MHFLGAYNEVWTNDIGIRKEARGNEKKSKKNPNECKPYHRNALLELPWYLNCFLAEISQFQHSYREQP